MDAASAPDRPTWEQYRRMEASVERLEAGHETMRGHMKELDALVKELRKRLKDAGSPTALDTPAEEMNYGG